MKAVVYEQFGGAEKLRMADLPIPKPADNEVQIRIHYTSVNPVDWKIREGFLSGRLPYEFPLTPGWDAAGVVTAVGKNVKHLKEDDEVYAYCRKDTVHEGTYAEYICFDAEHVALKPKKCSFAEAAAMPLTALTSWQALFDIGQLKKGQICLIHAGAGGVGSFAIQLAKWAGAEVITTCSQENFDYVKKLGATLAIDYHKDDFSEVIKKKYPKGIDLVFEMIGGETMQKSARLLKKGGKIVGIVEKLDPDEAEKLGIESHYVFVRPNGEQLTEMAKLIDAKKIQSPFIEEMRLQDAASAQEKSKEGHTRGKIVLKVS
ncbi:MAG: NADP-dependent oxidoreductase [Chlamydiia bacterium]|nr:NADP-dependent oxidoreductase [Chlamydiia bacterium]